MKKIAAILVVLAMLVSAACVAEGVTFKMGIDPDFPPYSYVGDDGEYAGYDVEMCKAACEILGWDIEIVPINWDTKLMSLDAGEIDCIWSGLTIDVLDPEAYTLSIAYCNSNQKILVKDDSGIETLADLAGKNVGVQLGTSADIMLQDDQAELAATFAGGAAQTFSDYLTCFIELKGGSIDAIAVDASTGASLIADAGEGYHMLDESLADEHYGICFRGADKEMCAAVEGALMQLVADGTYTAVAEKYVPEGFDTTALCLTAE